MVDAQVARGAEVSSAHLVQFYEHERDLARVAGEYLADGLLDEEVAIVIATPSHRSALEAELERRGIDVADRRSQGVLITRDAASTMAELMVDGKPDRDRFDEVIGDLLRGARATGRPVRAFGEMVGLLWDEGLVGAAIEVEDLWNELGGVVEFGLLCGYPLASVDSSDDVEAFAHVCQAHAAVVDAGALAPRQLSKLAEPVELVETFDATMTAPTEAREFVHRLAPVFPDRETADDSALVTAELATNAVMHARSRFSVIVSRRDGTVRVSVSDESTRMPRLRPLEPSSTSGRGLRIVSGLSTRWGTELTPQGKTVWAELGLSETTAPR